MTTVRSLPGCHRSAIISPNDLTCSSPDMSSESVVLNFCASLKVFFPPPPDFKIWLAHTWVSRTQGRDSGPACPRCTSPSSANDASGATPTCRSVIIYLLTLLCKCFVFLTASLDVPHAVYPPFALRRVKLFNKACKNEPSVPRRLFVSEWPALESTQRPQHGCLSFISHTGPVTCCCWCCWGWRHGPPDAPTPGCVKSDVDRAQIGSSDMDFKTRASTERHVLLFHLISI